MRKINITNEDITMGDIGCENSCPIALALRHEYNTTNVSVIMEDEPYIYVNDDELDMTSDMRDIVDEFVKKFDSGKEVKPFTLEVEGVIKFKNNGESEVINYDWDICRCTNRITSINFIWNCYDSKGVVDMGIEHGVGLLLGGLIAIAIGGTITFIVINKYVVNKEDEWKNKNIMDYKYIH